MKRSEFLTSAGLLSSLPLMSFSSPFQSDAKGKNQFLELIHYKLHPGAKQNAVADFYKNVAIPALNKIGITKVGVFSVVYGPNSPSLYVLVPHTSLEAVYTDNEKLLQDKSYLEAGKNFLEASNNDSAFVRMEKTIMRAFNELPTVEAPTNMMQNPNRIYEIRIYESSSAIVAKKKIHMFNEGGEIGIFKKTGLRPVFFGETIAGQQMPNLQYMLVFDNMEARDKNWDVFRNDPDWTKLKNNTYYADTVSCITDIILKPLAFSQI